MKTFKRSIITISIILIIVVIYHGTIISDNKNTSYNYDDVILIINNNSQDSKDIGNYFKNHRNINDSNIIYINTVDSEDITLTDFNSQIRSPIEKYLISNNLTDKINYIVTTKGIPLKITDIRRSVDSELTLILGPYSNEIGSSQKILNPYFNKSEKFSKIKFGIYLVTRLDGYTYIDIKNLIDRSKKTTNNGVFILDVSPDKDETTYGVYNDEIRNAASILKKKGYDVVLDNTSTFITKQKNVLGYVSWGSNDPNSIDNAKTHNIWLPGSIAETAVSSSARTFNYPPTYGQSLVADLIAEGVTGASGFVYEPYLDAIAQPDILFDRYTDGYSIAESYYMAYRYVGWMSIVIGDPKTALTR